jgi:UDP:flavonoid glycosyltransferase YjiC (YdhE family)
VSVKGKIVLATWGSLGDLHPFIAVALRLKEHALQPVIASSGEYRAKIEAEGILFQEVRPSFAALEAEFGADLAELLRQMTANPALLYRKLVFPFLRRSYEDMMAGLADADLLVTSTIALAARLAAEKRGIPCIGAALQPAAFMSAYDPPALVTGGLMHRVLQRLGPRAAGLALGAFKRIANLHAEPVHTFRREIGLPVARVDPLFAGQFTSVGSVGLYSPLLGSVQPDFPPHSVVTGFPFYDSEQGGPGNSNSELSRFLAAGPRPLVFTLGSTFVRTPGTFYRDSLKAARKLNRRAVLLVGDTPHQRLEDVLSEDVCVCSYEPYSRLFPYAEVIVHQGGIGTTAQALRAGRPQLIVPFFGDQPDNAARIVRLGVGRAVSRRRYGATRATHELATLLEDGGYGSRALAAQQQVARENGANTAAEALISYLGAARGEARQASGR